MARTPFAVFDTRSGPRKKPLTELPPGTLKNQPPKKAKFVYEEGDVVLIAGGEETTISRIEQYETKSSFGPHGSGGKMSTRVWVKNPRKGAADIPVSATSLKFVSRPERAEKK